LKNTLIFLFLLLKLLISMQRHALILLFLGLLNTPVFTQKWEFGPSVGVSTYLGDLSKGKNLFNFEEVLPNFAEAKPAGGFLVRHHTSRFISLQSNLLFTKISAKDAIYPTRIDRGFSFSSPLVALNVRAEWDILGNTYKRVKPAVTSEAKIATEEVKKVKKTAIYDFRRFSPYVFVGLGATYTNPKTTFKYTIDPNFNQLIETDRNADYKNINYSIPFGLGLKYNLTRRWGLGIESGLHATNTDYLDGVSLSGNRNNDDWYLTGLVSVVYRLLPKDKDKDGVSDEMDACPSEFGAKTLNGCPDADLDGVADKEDACPDAQGLAENKGCPDSDFDGVADKLDQCPNVRGNKNTAGCPDSDLDGVSDKDDLCPSLKGAISAKGCPDADLDGIADKNDLCPNSKGTALSQGCPDTDEDGILDKDDLCPTDKGALLQKGCPDTDFDGIPDKDDDCPTVAGVAAAKGCVQITAAPEVISTTKSLDNLVMGNPTDLDEDNDGILDAVEGNSDNDGDGVPNYLDLDSDNDGIFDIVENNGDDPDFNGQVGSGYPTENADGIPIGVPKVGYPLLDLDGDGIPNQLDLDSDNDGQRDIIEAGGADADDNGMVGTGRPKVDENGLAIGIKIMKPTDANGNNVFDFLEVASGSTGTIVNKVIYFNTNAAKYEPDYERIVKEVVDFLKKNPEYKVRVEGHTDNVGTDVSNMKLSVSRARTSRDKLLSNKISASRIVTDGFGETRPANTNVSEQTRRLNRRVEFVFFK
jgi:OmpA-OmpF porin, OOP family